MLLQQIPSAALPKTFQDAIEIARYLGFGYIWIDSLCIIQDDSKDWESKAALMSDVYSSSRINITASSAADGRFGWFF